MTNRGASGQFEANENPSKDDHFVCSFVRSFCSTAAHLNELRVPILHNVVHVGAFQRLLNLVHRVFFVVSTELDYLHF